MFGEKEKPINAIAVSKVLIAATLLVPNLRIRRGLLRLDTIVPQATVDVIKLPYEIGSSKSA